MNQQRATSRVTAALKASNGGPVQVPFDASDVGGKLVAYVSQGLYSDPRDCLREYAQNSVDAGAKRIDIVLTNNNNVIIEDDGSGMSLETLMHAKRIAMSTKDPSKDVGRLGLGLYSSFPICQRMRIETQTKGSRQRFSMTFEFGEMRERLANEDPANRIALLELLQTNINIGFETTEPAENPGTIIHLDNVNATAYDELSDWSSLQRYLIDRLPVEYDDSLVNRAAVEEQLKKWDPKYRTVAVWLENTESGDSGFVRRSFPSDPPLESPKFYDVFAEIDGEARLVAGVWAALGSNKTIRHDSAGFLYKYRGFTVGDSDRLRKLFTRSTAYNWFVGEVWVFDAAEVLPNTARNDFEAGTAKRRLENAIKKQVFSKLGAVADKKSRLASAEKAVTKAAELLNEIEAELKNGSQASEHWKLRVLLNEAKNLLDRKLDDDPDLKAVAKLLLKQHNRATKVESLLDEASKRETAALAAARDTNARRAQGPNGARASASAAKRPGRRTGLVELVKVFRTAGWTMTGETVKALNIVEQALLESLAEDQAGAVALRSALERLLR